MWLTEINCIGGRTCMEQEGGGEDEMMRRITRNGKEKTVEEKRHTKSRELEPKGGE